MSAALLFNVYFGDVVWDGEARGGPRSICLLRQGQAALFHVCLITLLFLISINSAAADDDKPTPIPWREVWTGVDATHNTWLVYSGMTLSPFGHIHDDGLRIRFATGYGQYDYSGFRTIADTSACHRILGCRPVSRLFNFEAVTQYAEILVGYLKRIGELTTKVFVGAAYSSHHIGPSDPENEVQGAEWGVKGGIELWLNLGDDAWASLDTYYSTAHNTFSGRTRYGYRILPSLSIGPEAGMSGHIQSHSSGDLVYTRGRAGAFTRYEWAGGEISASGGVSADIEEETTPYVTLNWMSRF